MATLSQLYNAYLQDDPNVGEMTYDPFGWNIEQTFAAQDDDDDDGGGGGGTSREDYGDTFGVDPAKLRLPSSFQPTNIGYYGDEGTVGLPGHITQRGPGRQLDQFEYKGKMYDDLLAPASLMDKEEDASWFKQLREGFSPLMQGVMAVASPFTAAARALGKALPISETSILQNEMLGQGFALDDLGRIVNVTHGKRDDGTYGYIDYVTPENVMAGYRPTKVGTFDKRIAKIKAGKSYKELSDSQKRYVDAIEGAKDLWLTANEKKKIRVNQLKRKKDPTYQTRDELIDIGIQAAEDDKGSEMVPIARPNKIDVSAITGVDDSLKKRNYLDIFEEEDEPIPHIFSTAPGTLLEDEYDEGDQERLKMLSRAKKEKIASMDDAGRGVTYPKGPNISDLLTKTPLEQMIEAESRIIDLPDPGGDNIGYNEPGPSADHGEFGPGSWMIADGGMVKDAPRRPYGKGGIVDLL